MSSRGASGWFLQRVSGALLFITLGAHFYIYHYFMGPGMWGFESIGYGANDIATLEAMAAATPDLARYYKLASLFANPIWKVFDVAFITLACYHGFYGIRSIIDDIVNKKSARTLSNWFVNLLGLILWLVGVVAVITFNPKLF